MSSMNQAFVKAFSRRHATEDKQQATTLPVAATPQPGVLKVDPSVADLAAVWVDDKDAEIARADVAESGLRKPHVGPGDASVRETVAASETSLDERLESLQQVHTAYANSSLSQELAQAVQWPATAPDSREAPGNVDVPVVETRIDPPVTRTTTAQPGPPTDDQDASTPEPIDPVDETPAIAETMVGEESVSAAESFRAAWEVDVFDIPNTVADLFFDGQLFQQIAERMLDAVNAGLGTVMVTSVRGGEGRSSVAIGMSMAAAAAGLRVALVDGDCHNPTLCEILRLELEHGWIDCIRRGLPIKEVAVHAIEDGVTLIPLMAPDGQVGTASAGETTQLIERLQEYFDLVIVDGPAGSSSDIDQCGGSIDSAVIVCNPSRTGADEIQDIASRLSVAGVLGIGIVENFT